MRIGITGTSGLVGTALRARLAAAGHEVIPFVRLGASHGTGIGWDPEAGSLDLTAMEGLDAIVHLAGENIAGRRWSREVKARILESRVRGTAAISEAQARAAKPPGVLVCASAIGYYGNRGEEPLDESSPPGEGFLPEVCQAWERAADPAREAGVRVVHLRIGVVLSARGGALAKMLTPFRLGLGGPIGGGHQIVSWIALGDLVRVIELALEDERCAGPINATAPEPVPQKVLAKTLGRILGRPAVLPLPAFAVRAIFGEMGEELLLQGARVLPRCLESLGFTFAMPHLEDALRAELRR